MSEVFRLLKFRTRGLWLINLTRSPRRWKSQTTANSATTGRTSSSGASARDVAEQSSQQQKTNQYLLAQLESSNHMKSKFTAGESFLERKGTLSPMRKMNPTNWLLIGSSLFLAFSVFVFLDSLPVEAYTTQVTHDNAYYCHTWRASHEEVRGASDKQMDKLCKSIGV